MKVKQFFRSTAFKSLAVLTAIVIIAGALLAIFNDLLSVSAEERRNRDFQKIYGGDIQYKESTLELDKDKKPVPIEIDGNKVTESWLMSDGSYAIQTIGSGGFQQGTITVWTVFDLKADKTWGIRLVKYSSDKGQSYMNRFTGADYEQFTKHNSDLIEGKLFGDGIDVIKTGASAPFTFGALTRAVNCAVTYFKTEILKISAEPDIYKHQNWIGSEYDIKPVEGTKTVEYSFTVKGKGDAPDIKVNITVTEEGITSFAVDGAYIQYYDNPVHENLLNGNFFKGKSYEELKAMLGDDDMATQDALKENGVFPPDIQTGATHSSSSLIRAAVFALENYTIALYPVQHDGWVKGEVSAQADAENKSVVYSFTVKGKGDAPDIKVNITVTEEGITSFAVDGAYIQYYDNPVHENLLNGNFFKGKSYEELKAMLGDDDMTTQDALKENGVFPPDIQTGATHSSSSLVRAAVFALSNYEGYLAKGGTQE